MTQSSISPIMDAKSPAELLASLKYLKNEIIGNTFRKLEVVRDREFLSR